MKFAIIENGRVANVAESDAGFAASQGWIPAAHAAIGDAWDGEAFTAPPATPTPVPQAVTPLQGLLAIDLAGLSVAYEAWASDPARTFSERAFIQKAQTWRRDDPLLQAATDALGMTPAQLDALFIAAAKL